ncbi:hypothetical protein [Shewanella sp. 0m-4]
MSRMLSKRVTVSSNDTTKSNNMLSDRATRYKSASKKALKYKPISHKVLSLSYLLPSWGLLLWLNFSTEPNLFAHFIAIPSLLLLTGYSAYIIARKGG